MSPILPSSTSELIQRAGPQFSLVNSHLPGSSHLDKSPTRSRRIQIYYPRDLEQPRDDTFRIVRGEDEGIDEEVPRRDRKFDNGVEFNVIGLESTGEYISYRLDYD